MILTKYNYANSPSINSMVHAVLLGIMIALYSGYSESAEMEEVHALIEAAKVQMREINETDDKERREYLIKAHRDTMENLYAEFKELQEEGKLTGNTTLMADIMFYQFQMLDAMMHEIQNP